jgi:hypothetical protein
MKNLFKIICFFAIFQLSCGTNAPPKGSNCSMESEINRSLKTIAKTRIFFGHQSVGNNIIEGIKSLHNKNSSDSINFIELPAENPLTPPFFLHKRIGKNRDPKNKCDEFKIVVNDLAREIDIAILKFCYIDISAKTDVEELFNYYKQTVSEIRKQNTHVTIIHTTVPLISKSGGDKSKKNQVITYIKRVLGQLPSFDADNIKRNEYNNLLREYFKTEPIIDIAKAEAFHDSDKEVSFCHRKKNYQCMYNGYTNDGGHLNKLGQKKVAENFVKVLAGELSQVQIME